MWQQFHIESLYGLCSFLELQMLVLEDQSEYDDAEDSDPDLLGDPILSLHMQSALQSYMLQLASHPGFPAFLPFLTPVERKTLVSFEVPCPVID